MARVFPAEHEQHHRGESYWVALITALAAEDVDEHRKVIVKACHPHTPGEIAVIVDLDSF